MKLHIGKTDGGKDFSLPVEVVGQTQAVLAIKGAGKTYAAKGMMEQVVLAGFQAVAIDPTGVWWGLSADGDGPALPVLVMGGSHGRVPLEPTSGEIIATFVVDSGKSVVLDVSHIRKAEMHRFMAAFLDKLYHYKASHRESLHVFFDEADQAMPQNPGPEQAKVLGAAEDCVRMGRSRGIGMTMITQRPAVLNKNVLEMCEVLYVLRVVSQLDQTAIRKRMEVDADSDTIQTMLAGMARLANGQAWVWSPAFLKTFTKIQFKKIQTFDSSQTPKPGETVKAPKRFAEIDIDSLSEQIKATVERAKADDPKVLRAEIVALKRSLAARPAETVEKIVEKVVEVPALKDGELKTLIDLSERLIGVGKEIAEAVMGAPDVRRQEAARHRIAPPAAAVNGSGDGEKLGKCERSILTALAQHGACGKERVAKLAGYAVGGGGFLNALGALRAAGSIEGDPIQVTQAGLRSMGQWTPLPTGRALFDYWHAKLGRAEQEILRVLYEAGGLPMSKEEIAAQTTSATGGPYESKGGGFLNAIGALRTLALVEGRGDLNAAAELFE